MNSRIQILFATIVFLQTAPTPVAARDLLPANSTWKLRWDTTLDGELKSEQPARSWEVVVCNNRIHVEGGKSVLSGEIVDGKVPVFTLRQDDAQGYVTIYAGKLVERTKMIVGTWVNTLGQSGDFVFELEN